MTLIWKPLIMGMLMGLMMLWMLHGQLTGDSPMSGPALAAFIGAHLVLLVALVGGGLFAARLSPKAQAWLSRLHRPSPRHIGLMLVGALSSAGLMHMWLHGIA